MATTFASLPAARRPIIDLARLRDPALAIGGARCDAVLFWGAPLSAFVAVVALSCLAALLPAGAGAPIAKGMIAALAILTYAHLIAVVPRAYLNRDVRAANPLRLTLVPALLLAALVASPLLLAAGLVLAVFWDVHHSAMQTFGLGRIYDMKAGNDPLALRRTDLLLNAALYIGPAAAGASMIVHVQSLAHFDQVGWHLLTAVPGAVAGWAGAIRLVAILAWLAIVGTAAFHYARAARAGYRASPHKLMLLGSTALVSILAWGFAPPFVAFGVVNLFHAFQYFAIVWLKEGGRIRALAPRTGRLALPLFLGGCGAFGIVYWIAASAGIGRAGAWLAPFVACSLLHFWYDAFVWSVRRKQL